MSSKIFLTKILSAAFVMISCAFSSSAQSVAITPRKVTYTRPRPLSKYKRKFTVTYPKIKAATPALSRRIESAISYQKILGLSVREEITAYQWLEEADYEVLYNARGLLCVSLFMSGSGAYPSGTTRSVVVNIRNGQLVTGASAFSNRAELAQLVREKQLREIETAVAELKKEPDLGDEDPSRLFANIDFKEEHLEHFSIDNTGVTFHFDYSFPHVVQALQPDGEFKFTWAEIAKFVKPDSPFAGFLVK